MKRRSVLHATADQYAEGATVHGVGYIFDELLPAIDRIIWTVSVLGFFALAVFFTTNAYNDWQENLVITTLKNTAKDVTELPFPAVTVCSAGLTMATVSRALSRDFAEWADTSASKALHADPLLAATRLKRATSEGTSASDYMLEKFGIPADSKYSIFDVLNAMSSGDVEKSTAVNGVAQNQIACKDTDPGSQTTVSEETLCIDSGGVPVPLWDGSETSTLCTLLDTEMFETYDASYSCQKINGLNTSSYIGPWGTIGDLSKLSSLYKRH
jgi:hypothetical protein